MERDEKRIDLGPTGQTVAFNVERLRTSQGLSYASLSRRLAEMHHPIAVLGLSHIEKERRRVDADDLLALSVALQVNPNALLLPPVQARDFEVRITGIAEFRESLSVWSWARGDARLSGDAEPGPAEPRDAGEAQRIAWLNTEFLVRIQGQAFVPDGTPNVRQIAPDASTLELVGHRVRLKDGQEGTVINVTASMVFINSGWQHRENIAEVLDGDD